MRKGEIQKVKEAQEALEELTKQVGSQMLAVRSLTRYDAHCQLAYSPYLKLKKILDDLIPDKG